MTYPTKPTKARRPILRIPRSPLENLLEAATIIGILYTLYITLQAWSSLPATIPTHFDLSGRPDGYSGKVSILFLPIMEIGLYLLLTFVSRLPHSFNYPWPITEHNAERQYRLARTLMGWLKLEITWLLAYTGWLIIRLAQQQPAGPNSLIIVGGVIVIIGTVIIYLVIASRAR